MSSEHQPLVFGIVPQKTDLKTDRVLSGSFQECVGDVAPFRKRQLFHGSCADVCYVSFKQIEGKGRGLPALLRNLKEEERKLFGIGIAHEISKPNEPDKTLSVLVSLDID